MTASSVSDLYSRHIFLFPFKWKLPSTENKMPQGNLDALEKILTGDQQSDSWERSQFSLNELNHYNEFNYFYDFVREILYDLEDSPLDITPQQNNQLLRHYQWKETRQALVYEIGVQVGNGEDKVKPYQLDLDSVLLNLYETGIGVLTFFLGNRNDEQASPADILRINQFGRRIFPPFFGVPAEQVGKEFDYGKDALADQLDTSQQAELAHSIRIYAKEARDDPAWEPYTEDFKAYAQADHFAQGPFRLPAFIRHLFVQPDQIHTQEAAWLKVQQGVLLKPVLDDRMFVVSWYGGMEKLKEEFERQQRKEAEKLGFELPNNLIEDPNWKDVRNPGGDYWYKLLFVDGNGRSCQDVEKANGLLRQHSNMRWAPYTLYGHSKYSLVCLTDSLATLRENRVHYLPQHVESIYYKLAELCLVQRATVLRFSDEATHLVNFSHQAASETGVFEKLAKDVRLLYQDYIRFIHKMYFREVSAQEQGMELYDALQAHMRIEDQVKDLDQEIEELHRYVEMVAEERRVEREKAQLEAARAEAERQALSEKTKQAEAKEIEANNKKRAEAAQRKLNTLTIIGALFLGPSFVLAMYGLEAYKQLEMYAHSWHIAALLVGFLGLGLFSIRAAGIDLPSARLNRWFSRNVATLLLVGLFLLLLFLPFNCEQKTPLEISPAESVQPPTTSQDSIDPNQDTLEPLPTPNPTKIDSDSQSTLITP